MCQALPSPKPTKCSFTAVYHVRECGVVLKFRCSVGLKPDDPALFVADTSSFYYKIRKLLRATNPRTNQVS